jgi:hypothetical protein
VPQLPGYELANGWPRPAIKIGAASLKKMRKALRPYFGSKT